MGGYRRASVQGSSTLFKCPGRLGCVFCSVLNHLARGFTHSGLECCRDGLLRAKGPEAGAALTEQPQARPRRSLWGKPSGGEGYKSRRQRSWVEGAGSPADLEISEDKPSRETPSGRAVRRPARLGDGHRGTHLGWGAREEKRGTAVEKGTECRER